MTPKSIVFFAFDAVGHIHPILAIGKELKKRGHSVHLVTLRTLSGKDRFLDTGIQFHHCIEAQEDQELHHTLMEEAKESFKQGPRKAFERTYSKGGVIEQHCRDVSQHHQLIEDRLQSLKPDLILIDFLIGIPATTYVAPKWVRLYSAYPSVLFSACNEDYVAGFGLTKQQMMEPEWIKLELDLKAPLIEMAKDLFREKGLAVWDNKIELAPSSPYLNFYHNPRELCPNQDHDYKSLDETWFRLEHTIDDDSSDSDAQIRFKLPKELENLPGKLIYFSLGTLVTSDTELINKLLGYLSKSGHRVIVSKGRLHEQIRMYPNMWGDKFVDQKAILPQVDLFITHGGNNSVIEAFYYGVGGLLVLPVFADQFDSAQRVHDSGYGIRMNPYTCPENDFLDSIDLLLSDERLAQKMKEISSRLRSIAYHKLAADKLEQLLVS